MSAEGSKYQHKHPFKNENTYLEIIEVAKENDKWSLSLTIVKDDFLNRNKRGAIEMGLFDIFKQRTGTKSEQKIIGKEVQKDTLFQNNQNAIADSQSIAEDERAYYQEDSYYTLYSYPGTPMAQKVITFEERKKISYPSVNGLYVAEILLLEYCSYGKYPKPKSGYPGMWWFGYGIRDVGHALESLEKRGYLRWSSKKNSLKGLKVDELKQIQKKQQK